jgi:hypothetical protein
MKKRFDPRRRGGGVPRQTPRQALIDDAAIRARNGHGAHMALEAIVDECRRYGSGTHGAAIVAYYRGVSETGLGRLIKAVQAKLEADR